MSSISGFCIRLEENILELPFRYYYIWINVNIDIFRAVHIFAHFAQVVDVRKYDLSVKINHYRANRINGHMRENLSMRKCHLGLYAGKFSSAKISTFTVYRCSGSFYSYLVGYFK